MRICLVSQDRKLRDLIHEVVGTDIASSVLGETPPESDLYLWDVEHGFQWSDVRPSSGRHFFLVDRQNLADLGRRLEAESHCILLKPLSRATLEAFLLPFQGDPVKSSTPPSSAQVEAAAAERDILLQYALQTNLRLQEYDQDRTNFLARAVHDLRAPLTSLHGYCGLLLDGALGPMNSRQAELLRRMRKSAERMANLASSLLALTAEGHVERNLHIEEGDVEACLNQALHDLSSFIEEKRISIIAQLSPPEQALYCEWQKIEQVFLNLIENACKFTPKDGEINIRGYSICWDPGEPHLDDSASAPNAYRLDIQDSGPGIDRALTDRIFEQYTSYTGRGDRSGSGLGLAICKLIISAHGGKIWVTSSEEGSVFSFVLPFQPRVVLARRAPESEVLQSQVNVKAVSGQ